MRNATEFTKKYILNFPWHNKSAKNMARKEFKMSSKKSDIKQMGPHSERYRKEAPGAINGINTPGIELPAFNPPVPNRAWTAMKKDIENLTEAEKRELYLGKDY
jgi:hypothetical protein